MSTYNKLIKNLQSKIGPEIVSFALTAAQKGDLEAVTYICEYLETRKRKRHLNSLLRELNKIGFSLIPFLSEARKISETFQKNTKGSNHVYVILLNHEQKVLVCMLDRLRERLKPVSNNIYLETERKIFLQDVIVKCRCYCQVCLSI